MPQQSLYYSNSIEIKCEDLPDPANGQITFSSDNTAPFDFDTIANYGCDFGYVLMGGSRERECYGDGLSSRGQWLGSAPSCEGSENNRSLL